MGTAIKEPAPALKYIHPASEIEDYSVILNGSGIPFRYSDYYLQVGEIPQEEGWVIHLSVVKWQLAGLIELILPMLVDAKVPFKIIQDKETCSSLLDGVLSISKVGKVFCIYPPNEKEAIRLSKVLIDMTKVFKGPAVPTDAILDNIVYAGYRKMSNTPVQRSQRIPEDNYDVPFRLPKGIQWPFGEITSLKTTETKNILHTIYKPVGVLKADAKGFVWKGLYIGRFFIPRPCVIKQGKSNMWSDDERRDMKDRLEWQQQLYRRLSPETPMAKVIDLFEEDGDSYLVMEFITGVSLYNLLTTMNASCAIWPDQSDNIKLKVLDHLLEIVRIIGKIHEKGFVHRDITPVNFMVAEDKIVLIDTELAFDLLENPQKAPFAFGTSGYMSPNQIEMASPQVEDDIYGLGATMIFAFTGLSPVCFKREDTGILNRQLIFLSDNEALGDMISACVSSDPDVRPGLDQVQSLLHGIRQEIISYPGRHKRAAIKRNIGPEEIRTTVQEAILGLLDRPTIIRDGMWQTRIEYVGDDADTERIVFGKVPGIYDGMTGVVYVLSRLRASGWDISGCTKMIRNTYDHICNIYTQKRSSLTPGLYRGTAGISLAMASCIQGGVLERTERMNDLIRDSFSVLSNTADLADGATGQGVAALLCRCLLNTDGFDGIIGQIVSFSMDAQDKISRKKETWLEDQIGILTFLQSYLLQFNNPAIAARAEQILNKLAKQASELTRYIRKNGCKDYLDKNGKGGETMSGLILCFVRGYGLFKNKRYKSATENILRAFPPRISNDNFYQANGLAGLGELYLEAGTLLESDEWNDRAAWIANFLCQTARRTQQGGIHWMGGNQVHVTADMMKGNSGIIHFLARHASSNRWGYRLLS